MKKTIFTFILINIFCSAFSQNNSQSDSINFSEDFYLHSFGEYGSLWGSENKNLKLPKLEKESFITDDMWGHIMPKNGWVNTITVTMKELEYFAKLSNCNIEFSEETFRNPEHWDKFPEMSKNVWFESALSLLLIFENRVEIISIDTLNARQYLTGYPYGNPDCEENNVPVIYTYAGNYSEEPLLTIFISYYAISKLDINKIVVNKKIKYSGDNDEVKIIKTTVDLNNDGQIDILGFYQSNYDFPEIEEIEREYFEAKFIAVLYKGKWYRTSYTETGQDGLEGF